MLTRLLHEYRNVFQVHYDARHDVIRDVRGIMQKGELMAFWRANSNV